MYIRNTREVLGTDLEFRVPLPLTREISFLHSNTLIECGKSAYCDELATGKCSRTDPVTQMAFIELTSLSLCLLLLM